VPRWRSIHDSREPLVIHSVFSNINDETSTADFTDIIVSQGVHDLTPSGPCQRRGFHEASGPLRGVVVITLEPAARSGQIRAILEFRDGELAQVTAIGSPAHSNSAHGLRGAGQRWADEITYDAKQDIVRLSATLSYPWARRADQCAVCC